MTHAYEVLRTIASHQSLFDYLVAALSTVNWPEVFGPVVLVVFVIAVAVITVRVELSHRHAVRCWEDREITVTKIARIGDRSVSTTRTFRAPHPQPPRAA